MATITVKEIEKYASTADGTMHVTYHEDVRPEGSRTVREQTDKGWVTTEYDSAGNKIEKQ